MRIESLEIQEFGKRRDLHLDGFSSRLNVVHGPNGSGKSTAIQFIRWMLFGNCDVQCQRYLQATGSGAAGTMSVVHDGLRRTLARQDDGTRYGRLAVDGGDHYTRQTNHMVSLLGDLDQVEFDQIFTPGLDHENSLPELVQTAIRRGFDLTSKVADSTHLVHLRQRLADCREQLVSLPWGQGLVSELKVRREDLRRQIDTAETRAIHKRNELQRGLDALAENLGRAEQELDQLRQMHSSRIRDVEARRQELERTCQAIEDARHDYVDQRHRELNELDGLASRWDGSLTDVTDRQNNVEAMIRERQLVAETSGRNSQETCPVQSLMQQLEVVNDRLLKLDRQYDPKNEMTWSGHSRDRRSTSMRGDNPMPSGRQADTLALGTEIGQLKAEAIRLCNLIQDGRVAEEHRELQMEKDQLQQIDGHVRRWMKMIESRRDALAHELDDALRHGVSVVSKNDVLEIAVAKDTVPKIAVPMDTVPKIAAAVDAVPRTTVPTDIDPRTEDLPRAESDCLESSKLLGVQHSCESVELIPPELDARLRHLIEERDSLARELDGVQKRVNKLLAQRRDLEQEVRGLRDDELHLLRSEVDRLDADIRVFQARDELQLEINQLECEIAQLDTEVHPSPILVQASRYVTRLTGGGFGDVSIDHVNEVSVRQTGGGLVPYSHMSRELKDQLYLSLCLALIEAYGRRGIEIPLVLNDLFVTIGSEHDQALAAVIEDFSQAGYQVVIFTRHRHVADLFGGSDVRILELVRHMAPAAETTDHVRFRHHHARELDVETTGDRVIVRREPRISTLASTEVMAPNIDNRKTSANASVREDNQTLQLASSIADTGLIDAEAVHHLQELGIQTVEDFLLESVTELANRLYALGLNDLPLRRWQDEVSMRCWSNNLRTDEARVLVACGITDISELAAMDEDDLFVRVSRFFDGDGNSQRSRDNDHAYTRQQVGRWIREAGRSRSQWNGFAARSRRRRNGGEGEDNFSMVNSSRSPRSRKNPKVSAGREDRETGTRRRSSDRGSSTARTRSNGSKERSSGDSTSKPESAPRFYLNLTDPIVDAPSIGAKTAERLLAANIQTVNDLLVASAATVARMIDYHRIKEATIVEWQQQAGLVCGVPRLRGHDAQILVACGVTQPAQLAASDVDTLWNQVRPFTQTNEGKRVVRNGKLPDRDEVADWVRWAQEARSVKAA